MNWCYWQMKIAGRYKLKIPQIKSSEVSVLVIKTQRCIQDMPACHLITWLQTDFAIVFVRQ